MDVSRFRATRSGPVADGVATATLRGLGQLPTTVRKKVTLSAAKSGKCTILTLRLDTLDLTLLGLNVHLDKVDLKVTGRRNGGVLGSLFCSLARAKVKTSRVAAAARLTKEIKKSGTLRPLAFSVPVRAVASQAPSCSVLDLVLGPLNVNLLGLIVDLNRVHLTITANPVAACWEACSADWRTRSSSSRVRREGSFCALRAAALAEADAVDDRFREHQRVDLVVVELHPLAHLLHLVGADRCEFGIGPGDGAGLTPEAARCGGCLGDLILL